jgi:hypothetical protein
MGQDKIILASEALGERLEFVRHINLGEEMREQTLECSVALLQAITGKGTVHVQHRKGVQEFIFVLLLILGINLANTLCWKEGNFLVQV